MKKTGLLLYITIIVTFALLALSFLNSQNYLSTKTYIYIFLLLTMLGMLGAFNRKR